MRRLCGRGPRCLWGPLARGVTSAISLSAERLMERMEEVRGGRLDVKAAELVGDAFPLAPKGTVAVCGRSQPVQVFTVAG